MPANLTHMLIGHKAANRLREKENPGFGTFVKDVLESERTSKDFHGGTLRSFYNLGTLGPDLLYFRSLATCLWDVAWEGHVQAKGVEPWAYNMHSARPNEFPLRLLGILFRDAREDETGRVLDDQDWAKLAFVAGYLTHIAADQIIHPLVNQIAEPYYRSGQHRKAHRQCEVFQDYFLFEHVYRPKRELHARYRFETQRFDQWVTIHGGSWLRFTPDWFRCFLSRGVVETWGIHLPEAAVEQAVRNLRLVLWLSTKKGPYIEAVEEYARYREDGRHFRKYVAEPKYPQRFKEAVDLASIYLQALFKLYQRLVNGQPLDQDDEDWFLAVVSDADLTSPLQKGILQSAEAAFKSHAQQSLEGKGQS